MNRDDDRLARAGRALQRKQRLRQADLVAPGRSERFVRELEGGRAGGLRIDDVRAHFAGLGVMVRVTAWWNGASLDRLLDERHAALVDALVRTLVAFGWHAQPEVSFSDYGDRGSIDVFGALATHRAVFVGEAKSDWGSLEETLRHLDVKRRLAPKIAEATFGFRPLLVGTALVFPEDRTARRVADRFRATIDRAFPSNGREIRTWLRQPSGHMRGLWFLSNPPREAAPRRRST